VQRLIGAPFPSRTGSDGRTLTYQDIAILSRRRNEGIKFHKILRAHGIPSEFVGSIDFFSTSVIRDMLAYLNVINNPLTAGIALNRLMKISGITEVNMQRINAHARTRAWDDDINTSDYVYECMLDADELLDMQAVEVEELTRMLDKMHALKETTTLAELVYTVMMRYTDAYKKSLRHDDRRTMLLLNTFYEIVQQYESITKQPSVSDFLRYLALLSGFDVELEEREETDSIKVMTVHQSKGREFPVVFIVDAATNRFPLKYQSKPFYVPNDLSKGMKTGDDEKALYEQEERRLFYVAMTRAEQKLYLVYAERYKNNKKKTKPSKFLEELNAATNSLVNVVDIFQEGQQSIQVIETAIEEVKNTIQDLAVKSIHQMQLKTALQKLVELEKLRLLEAGFSLDDFDRKAFFTIEENDEELQKLFEGERVPLIGHDHHFSPTALDTFNDCPLQYKFSHVLKVPTLAKTYFNLGTAVHKVIQHLTEEEREGTPPTKERALATLERFWSSDAYVTRQKESEDKARAEEMIDTYLAWQHAHANEVIDSEMGFSFALNNRQVKGFIDRLERTADGEYVVIDYKTGYPSESKNSIRENIQMNVYCLAIRKKCGKLPQRASLFYVKHNKLVDYYPDEEHINAQQQRAEAMIDKILAESFEATPSYQTCKYCDYVPLCDRKESE
jgi:DNA helicase-2/ATP-dependent DNA helicase PcrA